jgi:3-oxoacyl-[acyl-carrier-protein] synthase-1
MKAGACYILSTGLVTSVGLSAPAACAAIRAGVTNPTETGFLDSTGQVIMAHQVPLPRPWRGRTKLAKMAALAIEECLVAIAREDWPRIPLILCVAERERPGRLEGLDDELFSDLQGELQTHFAPESLVVPHGRVSVGTALKHARELLSSGRVPLVLVAATDSLLNWPTLQAYESSERLLTVSNSNGFMPGEGAGAVLLGQAGQVGQMTLTGIGFAMEPATIESEQPLRGEGLTRAIQNSVSDAGCELDDIDFRISDVAGEQYYFKEAALALGRALKRRREVFDMWHPAECIGETGAVAGLACLAVAVTANRKRYAPGQSVLLHASADHGQRAAIVARTG